MSYEYQVYFILNEELNRVKIGKALDPTRQPRVLEYGGGTKMKLLATFPNSGETSEGTLHKRFRRFRVHGEWFKFSDAIQMFLSGNVQVVVPTYSSHPRWTPICFDCLRPIHPLALQCRDCVAHNNKHGLFKVPKLPRPQPPPPRLKWTVICYDCLQPAINGAWCRLCGEYHHRENLLATEAIEGRDSLSEAEKHELDCLRISGWDRYSEKITISRNRKYG